MQTKYNTSSYINKKNVILYGQASKKSMKIRKKKVRIDDISVTYLIKGNGLKNNDKQTPIIFIHGFPFDKTMWIEQLKSLPEDQCGIAIDVRGHGDSTIGQGFFSIPLFSHDLAKFMKHLKIDQAHICGVSMGGYIALQFMEDYPQVVKSLILNNTHSLADTNESKSKRFETIQSILKHGTRVFSISFSQNLFLKKNIKKQHDGVDTILKSIRKNNIRSICNTLLALASRRDTTHILQDIKVPTLLIYSDHDQIVKKEQIEILRKNIPHARLEIIKNSGHLPNIEAVEEYNEILNSFIANSGD